MLTELNLFQITVLGGIIIIITLFQSGQGHIIVHSNGKYYTGDQLPVHLGGTITGHIGMGKSTIRLHLISYFTSKHYQIYDFDFKGETTQYLLNPTSVIIPGKNCQINLFSLDGSQEYEVQALFIHRIISHNSDMLTPPQSNMLMDAIRITLQSQGKLQDLIDTIHYLGNQPEDKAVYSDKTSIALVDRLSWLTFELGSIFNCTVPSFDVYASDVDYFFDLSYLKQHTTAINVRRFVDIILFLITHNPAIRPRMIFVEEVQVLLQRSHSVLEEIITTLRHQNIGVFLCGTQIDINSPLLLDSGVHFQFHSTNLYNQPSRVVLQPYEVMISSPEINGIRFNVVPYNAMIDNRPLSIVPLDYIITSTTSPILVRTSIIRGLLRAILPTTLITLDFRPHYLEYSEFNFAQSAEFIRCFCSINRYSPRQVLFSYFWYHATQIARSKIKQSNTQYKNWIERLGSLIHELLIELENINIIAHYTKD